MFFSMVIPEVRKKLKSQKLKDSTARSKNLKVHLIYENEIYTKAKIIIYKFAQSSIKKKNINQCA